MITRSFSLTGDQLGAWSARRLAELYAMDLTHCRRQLCLGRPVTEPLQWKEEYSVGVPELDEQHKVLIALINRLSEESSRAGIMTGTLDALDEYVREHFGAEEALLRACGDPGLKEHERQHLAFEEWLDAIKQVFRFSESPDPLVDTVNAFLRNWLISHILKTDMAYKPLLTGRC